MIYTYDPSQVSLTICGYKITGWTSISVQFDEEAFRTVKGLRGMHTRVRNKSSAATLSVSVLQTGMANYVFSEIHRLDMAKGTARIELVLQDLSGETTFSSDNAYISGYPSIDFGAEAGTRQWKLTCLDSRDVVVGSNFKPIKDLF